MTAGLRDRIKGRIRDLTLSLASSARLFPIMVKAFRTTAISGRGSDLCLREGYLPLPVHYYSPVPDLEDLESRRVWDARTALPGIDFRVEAQLALLGAIGAAYADECRWPLDPSGDPSGFHVRNPSFSYGCAAATHGLVRRFRPATVVEIGSGMSSRVIADALRRNRADGTAGRYVVVDPYPDGPVKDGSLGAELHPRRVETLEPSFFERLGENDVLFIDSGRCVRIGGDVNFLVLEVLPRLAPGVIVHVHDIALPYEYAKVYAVQETFRQFWTEQYLLQAFLCFNDAFEVLLAMNLLMVDHGEAFRKAFPHYDPAVHPFNSGSFWIRRKTGGGTEGKGP